MFNAALVRVIVGAAATAAIMRRGETEIARSDVVNHCPDDFEYSAADRCCVREVIEQVAITCAGKGHMDSATGGCVTTCDSVHICPNGSRPNREGKCLAVIQEAAVPSCTHLGAQWEVADDGQTCVSEVPVPTEYRCEAGRMEPDGLTCRVTVPDTATALNVCAEGWMMRDGSCFTTEITACPVDTVVGSEPYGDSGVPDAKPLHPWKGRRLCADCEPIHVTRSKNLCSRGRGRCRSRVLKLHRPSVLLGTTTMEECEVETSVAPTIECQHLGNPERGCEVEDVVDAKPVCPRRSIWDGVSACMESLEEKSMWLCPKSHEKNCRRGECFCTIEETRLPIVECPEGMDLGSDDQCKSTSPPTQYCASEGFLLAGGYCIGAETTGATLEYTVTYQSQEKCLSKTCDLKAFANVRHTQVNRVNGRNKTKCDEIECH